MVLHSLRTRLIVACVSIVLLSLAALGTASYLTARRGMLASLDLRIGQLAESSARSIDEWVDAKARIVATLKAALDQPDTKPFLQQAAQAGDFAKAYIGRADKVHLSLSAVPAGYDPTARPWYRQAAAARKAVVTPPYLDVTSHHLVVTFADPLIRGGDVAAVAGADVALDNVTRIVAAIRPTPSSQAFLMARDGTIVTHPDAALALKPVGTIDAGLVPDRLAALARDHAGSAARIGGRDVLLYAQAIDGTDWLLVIAVDAAEATAALRPILVVSAIATLLASALAAVLLARAISLRLRRLDLIRAALVESGDGDITRRLGPFGRDELGLMGNSYDRFADRTTAMLQAIRRASVSVHVSAGEIASGNLDLSHRTEVQAGSIEETASAMEQLTATVKQNAESARTANALAASASDVAAMGGAVVGQVIETMGSIHASARKITDIIEVIDTIAFQTNILALNAAVEAARAGEQGRGFAVVAGEVRGLAQRSAAAARQVKVLIDDSVQRVESGSKLVEQAGATMGEVVTSVRRVTDIVGEITVASQEQSAGIEQVNQAIVHMDQAMQQNAALVEQAAATAQSLRDEAAALTRAVGAFKLGDGAG